ncbi:plasmid stabilization protein (plasmid) [Shinella sp. PSBB067]|uniref:FitA-like ribbon-helix-helix domain-containing protein n=1 Tax=Shinella sp. PSBB067 TaxID=2715959 RepID=UPI00193C2749|nr:plasmid stabilization protein [Shinella sp. PSBB067]QRI66604.1 plasmid stabilization protein [Shinella sp. PSBB067]
MPAVTIGNLSAATHRALKVRAAHHGRSTEAEMREILESAARPQARLRPGSALVERSRRLGLTSEDVAGRDETLARAPVEPMGLE